MTEPSCDGASASEGDGSERPPVAFSRRSVAHEGRIQAIDPTRAVDYADEHAEEGPRGSNGLREYLFQENVYVYDAMVAGWVVFCPVDFGIRDHGAGTYELTRGDRISDEVVQFEAENCTVSLDTLWDVRFPTGFEGLVVPPILEGPNPVEVVPRAVGGGPGDTALQLDLRVGGEASVDRGQAIAQIVPTSESVPEAGYRNATDGEVKEINKEVRRQRLYPTVYSKDRPSPRFGERRSTGGPGDREADDD